MTDNSFNPCCIGLGIQTGRGQATQEGFNPCCIGLGIQTLGIDPDTIHRYKVSILVVLDWVFKQVDLDADVIRALMFQSLLYWIGYSNHRERRVVVVRMQVSILVVLDWVFKRAGIADRVLCIERFQSLLYWIGYSNSVNRRIGNAHASVFQSLLYWIGYSNHLGRFSLHGAVKCFNPCCIGLGIQT